MNHRRERPAEPFFLKTDRGERFCLYHAPDRAQECRGAFIYVHPFAEEMNKSRRMAALQARAFANAGISVLQIDLFGCGDSSGDFADARWDIWKDDLAAASDWLRQRGAQTPGLWGLRLGALLALDFAIASERAHGPIVLWQPVVNGEGFLTQFLRMRMASEMLASGQEKTSGTKELRSRMAAGESLEVAGYELAPELAASIDDLNAANLVVSGAPVHWFELIAEAERPMPPAAAKIADGWQRSGVDLHRHLVEGTPFWASRKSPNALH